MPCMIGSEQPLWHGPVIPQHPGTRRIVTQNTQGPSLTEEYIMHQSQPQVYVEYFNQDGSVYHCSSQKQKAWHVVKGPEDRKSLL